MKSKTIFCFLLKIPAHEHDQKCQSSQLHRKTAGHSEILHIVLSNKNIYLL